MAPPADYPRGAADYPRGARFTISGLESAAHLNGTEVRILSWNDEKERFAVKVVAKVKQGEPAGHLVRPSNLVRSANWCARLGDDELSDCLSKLPSWQDATRASAVCVSWRRTLRDGSWPKTGHAQSPAHWREILLDGAPRFGSGWEEVRPFARPPRWSCGVVPSGPVVVCAPSWTWALHGLSGTEDVPRLLQWLDQMEQEWPGVAITRWPGAMQRLAWVQGLDAAEGWLLAMSDLRGDVLRLPRFGGNMMSCAYRDGGSYEDAGEAVPRCGYSLPADAALFFALLPLGFGEEASDGSFTHYNRGLEIMLEPWMKTPNELATQSPPLYFLSRDLHPCPDATKLLRIAQTITCWDEEAPEAEALEEEEEEEEATFWLCCDAEDDMFGKILMATGKLGVSAETSTFRLCWADVSFTEFLGMLLQAPALVRQTYSAGGEQRDYDTAGTHPRDRCDGRSPWDLIWQKKYGALRHLVELVHEREIRP